MLRIIRVSSAGLMRTGGSSSQQMVRGGVWVFASYGMSQALSLARSVILARILLPADFGLVAMAGLATAALEIFTETGIWPVLIQRKELHEDLLNTAWTIRAIRGVTLGLLGVALAPLVSRFFEAPTLTPILRVMALDFVLGGFQSLGPILLQRSLDFRRLSLFGLAQSVIGLLCSTAAALLLRNVWALVIGGLTGSLGALILSYLVHEYRPRFQYTSNDARDILDFGKFVTAAGILTYVRTQGDDAYVGKVLGADSLGYYGLAYRLSNLPATSISHVLNRVTLPAFSAIQTDLAHLRTVFLRTLRMTALVSIPVAGGLLALAPLMVGVLYGSRWAPVVPSLMVLCLFGLERSVGSIMAQVLMALGRPKTLFWIGAAKLAAMALCIIPLTARFGFFGTSVAVTISALVVQFALLPAVATVLEMSIIEILRQLTRPVLGTLLMVAVVLALRGWLPWPSHVGSLMGLAIAGSLVYGASVLPAEKESLRKLRDSLLAEPESREQVLGGRSTELWRTHES